jgi:hypothetical protein
MNMAFLYGDIVSTHRTRNDGIKQTKNY